MKKLLILFMLTLPFILSSCINCTIGSGNVISQDRSDGEFNSISLSGQGILYLTQGNENDIKIEAEDNIMPLIESYVENNKLIIRHAPFQCIRPTKPIKIYISFQDLNSISISGSGEIISQNTLELDTLDISISGSGKINLNLNADKLTTSISGSSDATYNGKVNYNFIIISGSADINALGLQTNSTSISISGAGKTSVNAQKNLDILVSGSGTIRYTGNPQISQKISGSADISRIES